MDRIDQCRIFARVVETGSFTRAAETLGLPRSTVSTAVQALEGRVGARLLTRTTRSVTPTPDGLAFYEHCIRLVADMDEAEDLFRRERGHVQGLLRVSLPARIGRLIVAPALPEFVAAYPGIKLELGVTDRPVNLTEEGLDCVLRVGVLHDSGLIARRMGQMTLLNVASPEYLARHGVPRIPADLVQDGHLAVRYMSPANGRVEAWEWEADGQLHTLDLPGPVTVNSSETQIACCLAGLGLIQVPQYDVRALVESGRLCAVLPQWCAPAMPVTLLYPHRRHLSSRLQAFAGWLEGLLAGHLV
ncbi:LysR family transcriptional regulator [Acetobacter ghanensis]|uniref:LysR family transcriptional regulator n=1 Tax=Acetobacter ghanensis TaxID=431306 RepID=A0A0U5FA51_9PROT|nr:LysR family transcriptional regulator [Acetobacter ghanensis]NHO38838.1 LysR family transcriptional regulator [Acetobacter ghanensis]GBQ49841.1 LysR family transcriptional regulator [Acetobacter ghanensis DSM 18895]CEF57194.1 LysR family transcriptional regulator [Acetobacter ghanensis]